MDDVLQIDNIIKETGYFTSIHVTQSGLRITTKKWKEPVQISQFMWAEIKPNRGENMSFKIVETCESFEHCSNPHTHLCRDSRNVTTRCGFDVTEVSQCPIVGAMVTQTIMFRTRP